MTKHPTAKAYLLRPGFVFLAVEPTIISTVLGSGVAVTIFDRRRLFGGMNNFARAEVSKQAKPTAMYGRPAIIHLAQLFSRYGSQVEDLEARIFGGACPPGLGDELVNIGRQNVKLAESLLERFNIKIVSRDTGGGEGRKVLFNTFTGETTVSRVDEIRRSDWFPGPGESG
jgi:chemotaxis protein CheD